MPLLTKQLEEKILRAAEQKALKMYGKRFAQAHFVGETNISIVAGHCPCGGKRFTTRVLIKSNPGKVSDSRMIQVPNIVVCVKCFQAKEDSVSTP